jgi:uncharacterized protein (DUF169 family)
MARQTITVETQMFTYGDVEEAKYNAFLAKTAKTYMRARAKGRKPYATWTDEQCMAAAHAYCGMYRHHFRAQIRIDPVTRQPIQAA